MERAWIFGSLAVTVACIDFRDPAVETQTDARERGVRVELRPTATKHTGSIYASDQVSMLPAVCRIDLLESAPHASDRMHWHPVMDAGEPGARRFDPAIPASPVEWLDGQLADVSALLNAAGLEVASHQRSVDQIADHRLEIVTAADIGLAAMRKAWPDVDHDERGMATSPR
jgi:hypothetical protein